MKASTKQERLTSSGPAEAHPHQIRASSYYQRSLAKRSRASRVARFDTVSVSAGLFKPAKLIVRGYGRHNPTVAFVRGFTQFDLAAKQPGRRYGPEPLSTISGRGASIGRRTAKLAEKHARLEIAP